MKEFDEFVQHVDNIININITNFQYIKNINLRTALTNVNTVANEKINRDLSPDWTVEPIRVIVSALVVLPRTT